MCTARQPNLLQSLMMEVVRVALRNSAVKNNQDCTAVIHIYHRKPLYNACILTVTKKRLQGSLRVACEIHTAHFFCFNWRDREHKGESNIPISSTIVLLYINEAFLCKLGV